MPKEIFGLPLKEKDCSDILHKRIRSGKNMVWKKVSIA
jgi:hypothetical protein